MKTILGAVLAAILTLTGVSMANAQEAGSGINFSASSFAVALHQNGNWFPGTILNEALDVKDSAPDTLGNVNSFYLVGSEEVFAPTAGFTYYGGGFQYVPTKLLDTILKSTNLSTSSFHFSLGGTVGNVVPVSGAPHISGVVTVGTSYAITQDGSVVWTPVVAGWQNPGTFFVSTGLQAFWGGKTVNSQSIRSEASRRAYLKHGN